MYLTVKRKGRGGERRFSQLFGLPRGPQPRGEEADDRRGGRGEEVGRGGRGRHWADTSPIFLLDKGALCLASLLDVSRDNGAGLCITSSADRNVAQSLGPVVVTVNWRDPSQTILSNNTFFKPISRSKRGADDLIGAVSARETAVKH